MRSIAIIAVFVCPIGALLAQNYDPGSDLGSCNQLAYDQFADNQDETITAYNSLLDQAQNNYNNCISTVDLAHFACILTGEDQSTCDAITSALTESCQQTYSAAQSAAGQQKSTWDAQDNAQLNNYLSYCASHWRDEGDGGGEGAECDTSYDCEDGYYCDEDFCQEDDDMDPILIDLSGTGTIALTDLARGVSFDILSDHKPVQMSWTAKDSNVGILVLDRNGTGKIDAGKDLFAGLSPQLPPKGQRSRFRKSGFSALASYDQPEWGGNGDGQIDKRDGVFSKLLVWVDRNHDGVAQADELLTLDQLGITAISLSAQPYDWKDAFGNRYTSRAAVTSNGAPLTAFDVYLTAALR